MNVLKILCRKLSLHWVWQSLGFDKVGEFWDQPPSQTKVAKGDENFFFRARSYLLTDTEELNACIRLKVTHFIRSNGACIQNVEAYLKQSKMG